MKTTLRFHFIPSRMASIKILLLQQLIIIIIKSDIKSEYESRKKRKTYLYSTRMPMDTTIMEIKMKV